MSEPTKSFSDIGPLELQFADQKISASDVIDGSFYYLRDFGLVVFLLREHAGFSLCVGQGNFRDGQTIRSFDRIRFYRDQTESESALKATEQLTHDFFDNLSDKVDAGGMPPSTENKAV